MNELVLDVAALEIYHRIRRQLQGKAWSVSDLDPGHDFRNTSLTVWSGASQQTIYAEPYMNWAFRVHHDLIHLQQHVGFSWDAELHATQVGIKQLGLSGILADVYWADNAGQQLYHRAHGYFPENQKENTISLLK